MTISLSTSGGQWTEYDTSLAGTGVGLQLRRRRAGVYVLTAHRLGPVSGSLVPDGAGGYTLTLGTLTGTGRAICAAGVTIIR